MKIPKKRQGREGKVPSNKWSTGFACIDYGNFVYNAQKWRCIRCASLIHTLCKSSWGCNTNVGNQKRFWVQWKFLWNDLLPPHRHFMIWEIHSNLFSYIIQKNSSISLHFNDIIHVHIISFSWRKSLLYLGL